MKECPECEVVNADTVERCDCGYDFVADPGGVVIQRRNERYGGC